MGNTTTIYLVRHGQTAANATNTIQGQSDVPLDETGLLQAELVGKRLRKQHFDVIFSSDLSRAAVTAGSIADGREVIFDRNLREWDLGDWVGLTFDEIKEKFPAEAADFTSGSMDAGVSGGESRRQFHDRAGSVMENIISLYPGKTVLCVTHGGVLRAIFRNIMCDPECHVRMIRTDNTCICCIKYFHTSGKWQIVTWNDTAHLEGMTLSTGW